MEIENDIYLTQDNFPAGFKHQDIESLQTFKKWKKAKEDSGHKVVKCPCCGGYELYVVPRNHICSICNKEYCQYCLHKIVEDEVEHDHERSCWNKFMGLVDVMIDWGGRDSWMEPEEYVKTTLIFIFGNHVLYSYKYFKYFYEHHVTPGSCAHWTFTILNLFSNIIYCFLYNFFFFEVFFTIFLPSIIFKCYFKTLMDNWIIVIEEDIDELPITELTVSGRGYGLY